MPIFRADILNGKNRSFPFLKFSEGTFFLRMAGKLTVGIFLEMV
jgi:hypothetical protein